MYVRCCPRCKETTIPKTRRYCGSCLTALSLKWKKDHPVAYRRWYLRYKAKRYGISVAEYVALLVRDNWSCAICGWKHKLCIDHDHKTGRVRGILCHTCNVTVAKFDENPLYHHSVLAYLGAAA